MSALAPLGEHPLVPVRALTRGTYLSDSSRPVRFHCHDRGKPRPSWLPPEKFCCRRDHYLQGKYGITCDQWWEQYDAQGGRCGICWGAFKPGRRVAVDHDHDTGEIDSLAHFGCNRGFKQRHRRYAKNPPGLGFKVAPAKLRAIQAADRAKRTRSRPAPTQPSTNGFHERTQAALEATRQGG